MRKLLFCVGEGLGNVIQTLPTIKALSKAFDVYVLNISNISNHDVMLLCGKYANLADPKFDYAGRIEIATTKHCPRCDWRFSVPLVNDVSKQHIYTKDSNEMEVYLSVAEDLLLDPIADDVFDIEVGLDPDTPEYDVIIHNGCSLVNPAPWQRKTYPYLAVIADKLMDKGFSVACIGSKHEYQVGHNCTGQPLKYTMELMSNARIFLGNDSGPSHLAALLKMKGYILYTATCTHKNYNLRFHRSLDVIRNGVPCQSCQYTKNWEKCSISSFQNWKCREIDPNIVLRRVLDVLENQK